jgi:transcriptional regulator with XRE-family HTH domain
MKDLQNIRAITGMAQESLASFLGLTRRSLTKAEKGISGLTTDKLLKLARLQLCMENLPAGEFENQLLAKEAQKPEHVKRERDCRYFIIALQRKVARLEDTFKKCMRFHEALNKLVPADEGDELWIQKMKKDIINKLDQCGPAACMPLRKRICLLTAEADHIHRIVHEPRSMYENTIINL